MQIITYHPTWLAIRFNPNSWCRFRLIETTMGTLMMSNAIGVDATMSPIYVHHELSCAPRHWSDVAEQVQNSSHFKNSDGHASLYGIWRSQIGLPRDVLTMISVWSDINTASLRSDNILSGLKLIKSHTTKLLAPTLRPKTSEPPVKQGKKKSPAKS